MNQPETRAAELETRNPKLETESLPPLFFFAFFQRVKHDLGYAHSMGKYMDFLQAIAAGGVRFDPKPGSEQPELMRFLRFYLLENELHRPLFEQIFLEETARERERMAVAFDKKFTPDGPFLGEIKDGGASGLAAPPPAPPMENSPPPLTANPPVLPDAPEKTTETIGQKEQFKDFWLMLGFDGDGKKQPKKAENAPRSTGFNLSDEYFPLTRRELMKTWQYLRLRQPAGVSAQLDIGATVRKVAREGFFMGPVFEKNWATRPDALLILADRDDAMTPFHELIDRITATARDRSAHPQAGIWFFHKYPINWLYKKPGLVDAHEVAAALRPFNPQNTLALIVSDGGAARGEPADAERVAGMGLFLKTLREKVAHVAWLNPLPRDRWAGTAADAIRKEYRVPMFPAIDGDGGGFSQAIQSLMEQKPG